MGRLYRTLLQAGAIKNKNYIPSTYIVWQGYNKCLRVLQFTKEDGEFFLSGNFLWKLQLVLHHKALSEKKNTNDNFCVQFFQKSKLSATARHVPQQIFSFFTEVWLDKSCNFYRTFLLSSPTKIWSLLPNLFFQEKKWKRISQRGSLLE